MTKEMFEKLKQYSSALALLDVHHLSPYVYNKTLLYGYTCDRETFHVYLKDKEIFVVIYNNDYATGKARPKNMRRINVTSNQDYVPNKRLYPERCDYNFCQLLKEKGIDLPFTTWTDGIELNDTYYGFTLDDIEGVLKDE